MAALRGRWQRIPLSLCVLCVLCGSIASVWAQSDELTLNVRRNVGYSGGSQIQGSFRMEVAGPESLTSVTFKIDGAVMGTATQPPFRVNFNTGDYALGWHELTAVGQTGDGRSLTSAPRRFEFVSAEVGFEAAGQIVLPLLVVVGLVMLVTFTIPLIQTLLGRKASVPLGAPRKYGLLGGAICPKCGRPFSIHWWGFNLLGNKLDRCDHCGRWSLVRRTSRERLAEAEAAELKMAQPETPIPELSPEEKLRRQIEESRFDDR